MRKKSDLPFGSEFSPSLAYVLELAELHGGNWHAFEAAVRTTYFKDDEPALYRHLAKHIL